jgi:hypothetical protein
MEQAARILLAAGPPSAAGMAAAFVLGVDTQQTKDSDLRFSNLFFSSYTRALSIHVVVDVIPQKILACGLRDPPMGTCWAILMTSLVTGPVTKNIPSRNGFTVTDCE